MCHSPVPESCPLIKILFYYREATLIYQHGCYSLYICTYPAGFNACTSITANTRQMLSALWGEPVAAF